MPASPVPTTAKAEKVALYSVYSTKVEAYAWEQGLNVQAFTSNEKEALKDNILNNKISGVYVFSGTSLLPDWLIFDLSKFVQSGGRVFFEVGIHDDKQELRAFQDYFDVAIAKEMEMVQKPLYKPGDTFTPLWSGLVVGVPPTTEGHETAFWNGFLVTKEGVYANGKVASDKTRQLRAISAYRKFGAGEVLFVVATTTYSRTNILTRSITNWIDYYDNKKGVLEILKWLAGKREY